MAINHWESFGTHYKKDYRLFTLSIEKRKHPISNQVGDFVLLDSSDWVNILPITTNNELVLVKQYRHGTSTITTEIPGGLIEVGEDIRLAAERECREETGYTSKYEAEYLGFSYPNPAFLNNKCHTFLWKECEMTSTQTLDMLEDIEVITIPMDRIMENIQNSEINHSIIMSALLLYFAKKQ